MNAPKSVIRRGVKFALNFAGIHWHWLCFFFIFGFGPSWPILRVEALKNVLYEVVLRGHDPFVGPLVLVGRFSQWYASHVEIRQACRDPEHLLDEFLIPTLPGVVPSQWTLHRTPALHPGDGILDDNADSRQSDVSLPFLVGKWGWGFFFRFLIVFYQAVDELILLSAFDQASFLEQRLECVDVLLLVFWVGEELLRRYILTFFPFLLLLTPFFRRYLELDLGGDGDFAVFRLFGATLD